MRWSATSFTAGRFQLLVPIPPCLDFSPVSSTYATEDKIDQKGIKPCNVTKDLAFPKQVASTTAKVIPSPHYKLMMFADVTQLSAQRFEENKDETIENRLVKGRPASLNNLPKLLNKTTTAVLSLATQYRILQTLKHSTTCNPRPYF